MSSKVFIFTEKAVLYVLFPKEDPLLKAQVLLTKIEMLWSDHGGRGWGLLSENKHSLVLILAKCGDCVSYQVSSSLESET